MVKNATLTIDHKSITVPETTTILEAARMLNINIPTLCYLKDVNEIAACRLCCVEVKGMERLVPACDNVVADGMEVFTNSPMAREARSGNCTLQSLANDFNMRGEHYPTKLRREAVDYSTPLIRENDKCVKCMRCIQICENVQTVKIWDLLGTGSRATVDASRNRRIQDTECTYCGQCITHCPTAALRERDDTGIVFDAIDDPNTVTVVQVAPAVRAAWAEQFNLSPEFATPKRMAAALRELGFNYVFDTDFAADLTIMEEGSEFLERFTHKKDYRWPMFTSCCPGWVRFLKSQYPERTEELSTAKSPQQMFGAIAKTYFAEKIGIDPKRLFVVSIMPCVAKKSECALPTMRGEDGIRPCTPQGIVRLLKSAGNALDGTRAVVIGRSNIVGKPAALMLTQENCTVTLCHSHTRDLAQITRQADILVAAVGKPRFVTADMVKPGAAVIDVGINRVDGKVVGDVDFDAVSAVAGFITPVPGGVGPMTVSMLMENTLEAAWKASR